MIACVQGRSRIALAQAVCSKQPQFNGPIWEGVSDDAKDLIWCVILSDLV